MVPCFVIWHKAVFRCLVSCLVCGGWLCGVCFFLFWGFLFLCVWCSCRCVKNACFSAPMLGFVGVSYSCLFGFGRFGVRWGRLGPTSPNPSCFWCLWGLFLCFIGVFLVLFSLSICCLFLFIFVCFCFFLLVFVVCVGLFSCFSCCVFFDFVWFCVFVGVF